MSWLEAWERAIFDVARLRFGRQCRNLRITDSEIRIAGWNGTVVSITRDGISSDDDDLPTVCCEVHVGIDVAFEETQLGQVYSHKTYSWLNVSGTTYRARWLPPRQKPPNMINGLRRYVELTTARRCGRAFFA